MVRRKVAEPVIKSWEEADAALAEMLEHEVSITRIEQKLTKDIAALKQIAGEKTKVLQAEIDKRTKELKAFVEPRREQIPGKTMVLPHGKTGYRLSTKVSIPKGQKEAVLAKLKKFGMKNCIKTEETINREALKQEPLERIELVGATYTQEDEFWCETACEKPGNA